MKLTESLVSCAIDSIRSKSSGWLVQRWEHLSPTNVAHVKFVGFPFVRGGPTGSASLQIERVISAELRTSAAKLDLMWMDGQFERKHLCQFGRNDALHLLTGWTGRRVLYNW